MNPYVRVVKINRTENPVQETANKETYIHGAFNKESPYIGYWLEGYLLKPVAVGSSIWVDRRVRNGEPIAGEFKSSRIQKIEGDMIYTHNSIYLLTVIS